MPQRVQQLVDSPLGTILLEATPRALCALRFAKEAPGATDATPACDPAGADAFRDALARLAEGADALRRYFRGELCAFDALAIDAPGSPFQRAVWSALREIPAGDSETYGALAQRLERVRAARAVGGAAQRNPLMLVVPCHRLVGRRGALVGYAGGIERKGWLLAHEARAAAGQAASPKRSCTGRSPARERSRVSADASI